MMRFFRANKKMAVVGAAVGLIMGAGGLAIAFFTTTGTGTGNAYVGQAASVSIAQLAPNTQIVPVYDSTISPVPASLVSQSFEATGTSQLGNQINLTGASETLNNVVVTMESWTCGNYLALLALTSTTCTTTPGTTFNEPITLNIYNVGAANAVGSLITSDTQTFAIPFRPTASLSCPTGDNFGEYLGYDGHCHNGMATNIVFSGFSSVVLPQNVIYGISYSTGAQVNGQNGGGNPAASLNVGLTTEPTQPSVGSDPLTGTGSDYIGITTANGGGYAAHNYCDNAGVPSAFRYDAGPCTGTGALNYPPSSTNYVPAVQFNASAAAGGFINLLPGGPGEAVDFSIHNPSTGPAQVHGVTFAITGGLSFGCDPSWFSLVQPTIPVDVSIPAGNTVNYQPSGGSITLINEPFAQNACAGDVPQLTFTSN